MYCQKNFKTKKELKEAVKTGEKLYIYQPNDMFGNPKASPSYSGPADLEDPHYPKPHSWYANVMIKEGVIVEVR